VRWRARLEYLEWGHLRCLYRAGYCKIDWPQGATDLRKWNGVAVYFSGDAIQSNTMNEFTQMLGAAAEGNTAAAQRLLTLVYDELRRLAAHKMAHEAAGQTLQPTALVHEAWLRLGGDEQPAWESRTHFFSAAAEAMRRILIDRARRKQAQRRGSGQACLNADEIEITAPEKDEELLAVSDALDSFALQEPAKAELVKLRYFVGMTTEEAARTLGISEPTAKRWWAYAKASLYQTIAESRGRF
jgi:RNA polymerase sigma factor (TIGR02999 family)